MESSISCSLGVQVMYGLGVPFGVIAREKFLPMSYWLFASPMPARICGCVATTWNASMKASWATFQLQRIFLAAWATLARRSSGHRAN